MGRKAQRERDFGRAQPSNTTPFILPAAPTWPRIPRPKHFQAKAQPCARSHRQEIYFVRRTFLFPPGEETPLSTPRNPPCQVLTRSRERVEKEPWRTRLEPKLGAERSSRAAGRAAGRGGLILPKAQLKLRQALRGALSTCFRLVRGMKRRLPFILGWVLFLAGFDSFLGRV